MVFALAFLGARLLAYPYLALAPAAAHAHALTSGAAPGALATSALAFLLGVLYALDCFWFVKIVGVLVRGGKPPEGDHSAKKHA